MLLLALTACRVEFGPPPGPVVETAAPTGEVWIYTSLYQSVIDALDPELRRALPGVEPRWFQSGSEKVAQRFEAETAAGASPACVLLTSDPFWFAQLAEAGRLRPHLPPNVLQLDRGWVDPEGRWVATRVSLMVIGARDDFAAPPTSLAELAEPRLRGLLSMPDPLASGTAFTWLAFATSEGWTPVEALSATGIVASGGSAAVAGRIESGERPVGLLLLENVLAARRRGAPITAVFPTDGAVVVPGPAAIPAGCPNPTAAEATVDWLLGGDGQRLLASGDLYPVVPGAAPPAGAPSLDAIATRRWDPGFTARIVEQQSEIKRRWAELSDAP